MAVSASTDRFNGVIASLAVKAPCKAVSIVNITLSGEQTVNGVAVVTDDRVLVTAQTSAVNNGIYNVRSSAWERAADFDGNRDAADGTLVVVATTPLVGFYQLTATDPVVIGTTALTFQLVADMDLAGNLADTATGQGASKVAIEDAAGDYVGLDVETALVEIGARFATGSFTGSLTGFAGADLDETYFYSIAAGVVTLVLPISSLGTSDATVMQLQGLPAAIQPSREQRVPCWEVTDNGVSRILSLAEVGIAGSIIFLLGAVSGTAYTTGSFTATGTKGLTADWTIQYSLNV